MASALQRGGHLPASPMPRRRRALLLTAFFGGVWLCAVGFGLRLLLDYETTPGGSVQTPETWPAHSTLSRSASGTTLVMLAHPRCPCTEASIAELAQVMAGAHAPVSAQVLFLKPTGSGADWDDTSLRKNASAIPGVMVISDLDGAEAKRFGAETSGHTLLFASDGRRLFSGGITQARGHAGRNAGETAILALINNKPADRSTTQVFGCSFAAPRDS